MAQTAPRHFQSHAPKGYVPRGMEPYIVVFEDWRGREDGARHEQVNSQIALAEKHRDSLQSFILTEGLSSEVYSVAAATTLGAIGIIATTQAAHRLADMNGVVRVMPAR